MFYYFGSKIKDICYSYSCESHDWEDMKQHEVSCFFWEKNFCELRNVISLEILEYNWHLYRCQYYEVVDFRNWRIYINFKKTGSDDTCFIHRVKMTTEDRECNWNWAIDIKNWAISKNPNSCFEQNILTFVENEYTLFYG